MKTSKVPVELPNLKPPVLCPIPRDCPILTVDTPTSPTNWTKDSGFLTSRSLVGLVVPTPTLFEYKRFVVVNPVISNPLTVPIPALLNDSALRPVNALPPPLKF